MSAKKTWPLTIFLLTHAWTQCMADYTSFPISLGLYGADMPAVSGQTVVWRDHRPGPIWSVYGRRLSEASEFCVCPDPAPAPPPGPYLTPGWWYVQNLPTISGNIAAFTGGAYYPLSYAPEIPGEVNGTFGCDLSTLTIFPVEFSPSPIGWPDVWGDTIVWEKYSGGIFGYSVSTGETFQISGSGSSPKICGDIVVWTGPGYCFNGKNLHTGEEFHCDTSGIPDWLDTSDKFVVWTDCDWDLNDSAVYAYDLSSHEKSMLYHGPGFIWQIAISGDVAVWGHSPTQDYYQGNIYGFRLSPGGGKFDICTNGLAGEPDISGDLVVWVDGRNGGADIYGAYIPEPAMLSALALGGLAVLRRRRK